jgi:nicotinate-nucleotide--dimethylbenzimidazole phosphoribosyltransferase
VGYALTMQSHQLRTLIESIHAPDKNTQEAAREHQNKLTKPRGALGRLEELSIWLAGIQGTLKPRIQGKTVIICAADHGVTAEGISAYPSAVTPAMVQNFINGGAGINAIARVVGAQIWILDVGVATQLPAHPKLINAKVRLGTRNLLHQAAMTRQEVIEAILAGADAAKHAIEDGANTLVAGDMGIGNTTAASALTMWYANTNLETSVGRGTGIDDTMLEHKRQVVQAAVTRARNANQNAEDALTGLIELGGLEIAAMTGIMLQGAASRVAVLIDGFIAGAAALAACAIAPTTREYLCATHVSVEPGHIAQLEYLGLEPLFNLGLRLGEGTGAALAIPMLDAAARTLSEMATFDSAAVPDKT